ncbi:hypothetical protein N9D63_07725 [Opitutales bacterium]|nr:hypothetical protein [Opitutales bacterium]
MKGYSPAPDPLQGLQASNTRVLQEPLPPQWLHQVRRITQRVTTFSDPSDCFSTRRTGTRSHLRPEPWHHTQVSNSSRTNCWPSPAHTPQAKRQASPWQFRHKSGSKRTPEQAARNRTTVTRIVLEKTRFTRQVPVHITTSQLPLYLTLGAGLSEGGPEAQMVSSASIAPSFEPPRRKSPLTFPPF